MNILILASINKKKQIELCQKFMISIFSEFKINVVASKELINNITKYKEINYIDEDTILNKQNFIEQFRRKFHSDKRATWYYQQFLKYSYGYNGMCNDTSYVVWDGDTIPLRKIKFLENGKYLFNRKTEYHMPYFNCITKLFQGIDYSNKCSYGHSFISEYMIFDVSILKEMIDKIGIGWIDKILSVMDNDQIFKSGFSEYETYGTYMSNYHRDMFDNICLNTQRGGTALYRDIPTYESLKTQNLNYDTITFE